MNNAQINCAITDIVGVDRDYVGSLDAMHEAEKVLDEKYQTNTKIRHEWESNLAFVLSTKVNKAWYMARATAAQRAEAFLRTLNLWNVNPDHLFLGTPADNTADMLRKGRGVFVNGERHGRAKLSERAVSVIKRLIKTGVKQTELASSFNVSRKTINHIAKGRTWTH